jgi:hypothetical protein
VFGLLLALTLSSVSSAGAADADGAYHHRVVVSTTSLDTEIEVEASLERNVNRLAAVGYEVTAIVGGHGRVLDDLLERKPHVAGLVDHGGHVFVVMARSAGRTDGARRYRLIHVRGHLGVGRIVDEISATGHRLVAFSHEGEYFHAAFEQSADGYTYRVYANRGRSSWMQQVAGDAATLSRLRRVVPMTLDSAVVELGPEPGAPGALEWFTVKAHVFSSSDAKLSDKTSAGFRVQLVRVRGSDIDVLLVRSAGTPTPTTYSLEDAPWGMPCGRGAIAGADVFTDGDTYCAVDQSIDTVSNQGLDLRLRAESRAGGRFLFDLPGCEAQSAMRSSRASVRRLVVAAQLEREITKKTQPGFRVTRALAGSDESGSMRVTVFATNDGRRSPVGDRVAAEDPPLTPDRDELLGARESAIEDALGSALAREAGGVSALLWVEVGSGRPRRVRLAGCTQSDRDKALAVAILRRVLVRTTVSDATVINDVVVDPWR